MCLRVIINLFKSITDAVLFLIGLIVRGPRENLGRELTFLLVGKVYFYMT